MSVRAALRILLMTAAILLVWGGAIGTIRFKIATEISREERERRTLQLIERMEAVGRPTEEILRVLKGIERDYGEHIRR